MKKKKAASKLIDASDEAYGLSSFLSRFAVDCRLDAPESKEQVAGMCLGIAVALRDDGTKDGYAKMLSDCLMGTFSMLVLLGYAPEEEYVGIVKKAIISRVNEYDTQYYPAYKSEMIQ